MLKRRSESNLTREALGADFRDELAAQNFYDNVPAERSFSREEHSRHSSAAELTLDFVGVSEGGLEGSRSSITALRYSGMAQGATEWQTSHVCHGPHDARAEAAGVKGSVGAHTCAGET